MNHLETEHQRRLKKNCANLTTVRFGFVRTTRHQQSAFCNHNQLILILYAEKTVGTTWLLVIGIFLF